MKIKWAILFLLPASLLGQKIELFGYFEPQYTLLHVHSRTYQLASNKLRVDLAGDITENVNFGANFDYITYQGKTEWNILDFLPNHLVQSIPDHMQPYYKFNFGDMLQPMGPYYQVRPDRIFLDNAYVRLRFKRMDIAIGRQQLSMGTGYTWNPTDLFNTKDVLDPTYEQPGHNAMRIDVPIGSSFGLVSYYSPGESWQDSGKMLKVKGRLGHFDFSVLGVQRYWTFNDYISFTAGRYERRMIGGDLVGELLGLGVWAEGGYNYMNLAEGPGPPGVKDFYEVVVGVDYTFDSGLYMMTEFYRNSLAKNDWKEYTLNDWMWMFNAELKTLSRDQMFALIQYPATDLISMGSMVICSISDQSSVVVPMLNFDLFQDVHLTIYGNVYLGEDGRTFASNMGNGALARLRVYY